MSANVQQSKRDHLHDRCKRCGGSYKSNIGTIEQDGERKTVWECGECLSITYSTPKCCLIGCGFIDSNCKCENPTHGYPRIV